jgi:hypothetical protein
MAHAALWWLVFLFTVAGGIYLIRRLREKE